MKGKGPLQTSLPQLPVFICFLFASLGRDTKTRGHRGCVKIETHVEGNGVLPHGTASASTADAAHRPVEIGPSARRPGAGRAIAPDPPALDPTGFAHDAATARQTPCGPALRRPTMPSRFHEPALPDAAGPPSAAPTHHCGGALRRPRRGRGVLRRQRARRRRRHERRDQPRRFHQLRRSQPRGGQQQRGSRRASRGRLHRHDPERRQGHLRARRRELPRRRLPCLRRRRGQPLRHHHR